jgi:hypothetical protein
MDNVPGTDKVHKVTILDIGAWYASPLYDKRGGDQCQILYI